MNINANKILSSIKMQMLLGDEDIKPIMHDSVRNILSATLLSNKWSGVMDGGERGERGDTQEWGRGNLGEGRGSGKEKNHSYVRLEDTLLKEGQAEKKRQDRWAGMKSCWAFGHHTKSSL